MSTFLVSQEEWDGLRNEPDRYLKLYFAIREHMDYSNGMAGMTYRFNDRFFMEALYVTPKAGRPKIASGYPTEKEWRHALEYLEKLGYLRRSNRGAYVFELPKAITDESVQKQRGTKGAPKGHQRGHRSETGKPHNGVPHSDNQDNKGAPNGFEYPAQRGAPPVSGKPLKDIPSLRSGRGDSPPPDQKALPPPASGDLSPSPTQKKKGGQLSAEMQEACRTTWKAYADAYFARYGADPVRNAKVNSQIIELVKRLGIQEAPQVAAWYLTHTSAYYIRTGHSIGALLADAEKLRTEWATGRRMTETQARQTDRAGTTASHVHDILAERRARR